MCRGKLSNMDFSHSADSHGKLNFSFFPRDMAVFVLKIGQFLMNLEYNFFSSKVVKFTWKMPNVQFLVAYCQEVPHSGKQSYFDIALIFHDISMWGELFKPDWYNWQLKSTWHYATFCATVCSNSWREPIKLCIKWMGVFHRFSPRLPADNCTECCATHCGPKEYGIDD